MFNLNPKLMKRFVFLVAFGLIAIAMMGSTHSRTAPPVPDGPRIVYAQDAPQDFISPVVYAEPSMPFDGLVYAMPQPETRELCKGYSVVLEHPPVAILNDQAQLNAITEKRFLFKFLHFTELKQQSTKTTLHTNMHLPGYS